MEKYVELSNQGNIAIAETTEGLILVFNSYDGIEEYLSQDEIKNLVILVNKFRNDEVVSEELVLKNKTILAILYCFWISVRVEEMPVHDYVKDSYRLWWQVGRLVSMKMRLHDSLLSVESMSDFYTKRKKLTLGDIIKNKNK